jgi:hypothetical protein
MLNFVKIVYCGAKRGLWWLKAEVKIWWAGDYRKLNYRLSEWMLISYWSYITGLRKQIDGEYYNDMKLDTSHLTDGREKKYW